MVEDLWSEDLEFRGQEFRGQGFREDRQCAEDPTDDCQQASTPGYRDPGAFTGTHRIKSAGTRLRVQCQSRQSL